MKPRRLKIFCTPSTAASGFPSKAAKSLILALDTIVQNCEKRGIKELVVGMAHRGRLNVLANVLNKPLDVIFNEFQGNFAPDSVGGNGDVKYHLGYRNVRTTATGYEVEINLAANPSHLEAVDPVVEGKARARQRVLEDTAYRKKVVPILIHGDAAFIGQGVVAEVFNMSQLPGYSTGGTVHFVVNNQIGFTTLPADSRSSEYCTEIAKMVDAPIFHVNGEDPIAVMEMAKIALEFRHEFGRDAVVDIYCYRRHGHNEGDEPAFTQPNLYNQIKSHPLPSEVFVAQIAPLGTVSAEEAATMKAESLKELNDALSQVKLAHAEKTKAHEFAGSTAIFQPPYSHAPIDTSDHEGEPRSHREGADDGAGGISCPAEDQAHSARAAPASMEGGRPLQLGFRRGARVRLAAPGGHSGAALRPG